MRDEGYAAVTSRKIAAKAGLKHQIIYYYFGTLDDLLIEVFRHGAEKALARLTRAVESKHPVQTIWKAMSEPRGTRFVMEFMALANHNEVIRQEIARYAEETRKLQADAIARHLEASGIQPRISPMLVAFLMGALARALVNETSVGVKLGHGEAEALVQACLDRIEDIGKIGDPVKALLG